MFLQDLFEHGSGVEKLKGSWQSHMHEEDGEDDFTKQEIDLIHSMNDKGYDVWEIAHVIGIRGVDEIKAIIGDSSDEENIDESDDYWDDEDWEEKFEKNAGLPSTSFDAKVKSVGQKAKSGEQETYYNPETGKYGVRPKGHVDDMSERAGPVNKKDWQKYYTPGSKRIPKSKTWGQEVNLEGFPNAETMTAVKQATTKGAGVADHEAMDSYFSNAMAAKGPVGAVGAVKERRKW
jgi:hypothetical protein